MNEPIITEAEKQKYDRLISAYCEQKDNKKRELAFNTAISGFSKSELADFQYYVREVSEVTAYLRKEMHILSLKQKR